MSPGEFKRGGDGRPPAASLVWPSSTTRPPRQRWPAARYVVAPKQTAEHARRVVDPAEWRADRPVRLVLIGTNFEVRVWEALLSLPMGCAASYSGIARRLGAPRASRAAVGSAVGRSPISFVVPCHRVLSKDGSLGGYRWGVTRKQALIGWEAATAPPRPIG